LEVSVHPCFGLETQARKGGQVRSIALCENTGISHSFPNCHGITEKSMIFVMRAIGFTPNHTVKFMQKAAPCGAAFLFSFECDERFVLRKQVDTYKHLK
jgi:hypothetical protein